MNRSKICNKYVTLGGFVLSVLICALIFGVLLMVPLAVTFDQTNMPVSAVTIFPVHTFTPTSTLDTATAEAAFTPTPLLIEGLLSGSYVKIVGTGGAGLRIRSEPGLSSAINFYGMDDEVFLISDGPIHMDDYNWWFITAPYDEHRSGWAASQFLIPIQ